MREVQRPSVWGPAAWRVLHAAAEASDAAADGGALVRRAVDAMARELPCVHCRTSLADFWALELGIPSASWAERVYHLHNRVNDKLDAQALLARADAATKARALAAGAARGKRLTFEQVQSRARAERARGRPPVAPWEARVMLDAIGDPDSELAAVVRAVTGLASSASAPPVGRAVTDAAP